MREIKDHNFVARGEYFRNNSLAPVVIHGSYSEFEHKPIKCLVVPDKTKNKLQSSPDWANTEQLRAIAQDGEDIWISELTFISSSGYKDSFYWEGIADNFIKGNLEKFDATDGKIWGSLFIPFTPLAQTHGYICNFDGTISFEDPTKERKGIRWATKYGDVELIDGYAYAKHQVGIDKAIIQIQRCQISFEIQLDKDASLASILKECIDIFDDPMWLISMLSRKRLTWFAGEALFIPNEKSNAEFRKAIIQRNLHLGYEAAMGYGEHESDLLISPGKLKTDLFQDLLTAYIDSEHHDAIHHAIIYVLMSYETAYYEVYIGIIYLALETLVAALSPSREKENSRLLDIDSFKNLTKQIEQVIHKEVEDKNIAIGLIENLTKINSIKSSSLASRLLSLLRKYDVPINKLWPSGVDIDKKLRGIIGRRDLYIHKGEIGNYDEYLYDFARIRTLVELWILKILKCPDDAINPHGITNLAPIDRIESPVDSNAK